MHWYSGKIETGIVAANAQSHGTRMEVVAGLFCAHGGVQRLWLASEE